MNNTNTNNDTFKMTLTPDGASLHAYAWALPHGWRAWSPHALRILRKPYRHARTHLELTDDVVSSLYDPQGARNTAAAFGLANVPELGLVQVYGGLATAETQELAVQAAALNSARLVAALQGRFRQSRFTLLSADEAAALYRHLWACNHTASLIGQIVPRLAPGMGSGHGINQLVTTDAQEQLERAPLLSGTLNMGHFLGYLLEQHIIEKERYIASLEFGTELESGTGEFVLSAYEITIPVSDQPTF